MPSQIHEAVLFLFRNRPQLAVWSAMAHGRDPDADTALRIAVAAMTASVGLDAERSTVYFDLVAASLSRAARKALQSMDPATYEYRSEFARRYIAQGKAAGKKQGRAEGRAEGKAEGKAELVLKLLTLRFGTLSDTVVTRVRTASAAEFDTFAERVITAASLEAVLGTP